MEGPGLGSWADDTGRWRGERGWAVLRAATGDPIAVSLQGSGESDDVVTQSRSYWVEVPLGSRALSSIRISRRRRRRASLHRPQYIFSGFSRLVNRKNDFSHQEFLASVKLRTKFSQTIYNERQSRLGPFQFHNFSRTDVPSAPQRRTPRDEQCTDGRARHKATHTAAGRQRSGAKVKNKTATHARTQSSELTKTTHTCTAGGMTN